MGCVRRRLARASGRTVKVPSFTAAIPNTSLSLLFSF
jgi:hypothetical protein